MRKTAFTTVDTVRNSNEAEHLIVLLRSAGLHPADLAMTTPLAMPGTVTRFPIQVPGEETELAKNVLRRATV
ncbi:MAG TPA: hypothetical protein VG938_11690 [Verrucomicrobiae bacterium]|jgi:hypothetical protein|nr:hypothetical protein [Verrucomicrobiae bacterium]